MSEREINIPFPPCENVQLLSCGIISDSSFKNLRKAGDQEPRRQRLEKVTQVHRFANFLVSWLPEFLINLSVEMSNHLVT